MEEDLVDQLDRWRAKHVPLEPKTKAIERIIRERILENDKGEQK
jgi:hypothetical protein